MAICLLATADVAWLLVRLDPALVTGAASSVGLGEASPSCTDTKAAATPASVTAATTGALKLMTVFLGLA